MTPWLWHSWSEWSAGGTEARKKLDFSRCINVTYSYLRWWSSLFAARFGTWGFTLANSSLVSLSLLHRDGNWNAKSTKLSIINVTFWCWLHSNSALTIYHLKTILYSTFYIRKTIKKNSIWRQPVIWKVLLAVWRLTGHTGPTHIYTQHNSHSDTNFIVEYYLHFYCILWEILYFWLCWISLKVPEAYFFGA